MPIVRTLFDEESTEPRPFTNAYMKILGPTIRSTVGAHTAHFDCCDLIPMLEKLGSK